MKSLSTKEDLHLLESNTNNYSVRIGPLINFFEPKWYFSKKSSIKVLLVIYQIFIPES